MSYQTAIPEYVLAPGRALFFRMLYARPDTAPQEGDSLATQYAKADLLLQRLVEIAKATRTAGWKLLEQYSLDIIRLIEQDMIWEALKETNEKKIRDLCIDRQAVLQWYAAFHDIDDRVAKQQEAVESLRAEIEALPQDEIES